MTLLTDRAARAGLVLLIALWGALLAVNAARASEVPPLIGDVRRVVVLTRRALAGDVHTNGRNVDTSARGDGPMCTLPLVEDAADDIPERETVERYIHRCGTLRGPVARSADPFAVLSVLRLERALGAPPALLVGAYCVEVAMRAEGRYGGRFLGDWSNGTALASGPFQLHENVWSGTCRGTPELPHDLLAAGACWWAEVLRVEVKARRVSGCAEADMLGVAEAAAANVRRYGWRCDARSEHWRMAEAMR